MNGINLREEMLRFNSLPVDDPINLNHYMSPSAAREHIDSNKLTLDDLIKYIPSAKLNRDEKKTTKEEEGQG